MAMAAATGAHARRGHGVRRPTTSIASRMVEVLTESDESLLAAYVDHETAVSPTATQRARGADGAGAGVSGLLRLSHHRRRHRCADPPASPNCSRPPSATWMARFRAACSRSSAGPAGEKIAYVRMFSGASAYAIASLRPRRRGKVTAISVFERGHGHSAASVAAGEIAQALGSGRGPDRRRDRRGGRGAAAPVRAADAGVGRRAASAPTRALRVALAQLAEQDPLINVRQDDERQEISVSLYGEVQKEVIQATLSASTASMSSSARQPPSTSSARSVAARRSRFSGPPRSRMSPERAPRRARTPSSRRLDCGSSRCQSDRESSSGLTSAFAWCRSTCTTASPPSQSTWPSTSATRCRKGSSVGGSPTAA